MNIEEKIQAHLLKNRKTLCCAESCTGGALSARLTAQAGASGYFLGSFITYSNAAKVNWLGVSETTLKNFGAVSKRTVEEMAKGTLEKSCSDYALAVSGIAGPEGGTEEKPVGTIFAAIGKKGGVLHTFNFHCQGRRSEIIEETVNRLLEELWQIITN